MITNCPVCGKCFDVLWPHLWRYKRNHSYLCSWTCLRLIDSKRKKERFTVSNSTDKRPRMSPADMQKAVEMFRNGDESLEQFLKDHGITNIYKWKYNTRIRYGIQSPAPEQVATVKVDGPLNIETDKPEEINVHLTHEGAKIIGKVIAKNEKPIGFLQEEAIKNAQSFTAMANGDPKSAGPIKRMKRYSVTAIRYPEIGEFYYDQKFNQIDWRTAEGDEVSMSPTGWKLLLQDLPEIFEALGVNV